MNELSISGVVIRETPIKDTDKIITVLTGALGKISVLAKGVKNIKSKNAAGVQLFCYSEFELIEKKGLYILKTAHQKHSFRGLHEEILHFALASYIVDTANTVTNEANDETDALRLVLNTLHVLSEKPDTPLPLVKSAYELKLMQICGYLPELSYCQVCACDLPENEPCYFSFSEGCVSCSECIKNAFLSGNEIPDTLKLSYPVIQAMRFICESELSRFLSFRLDKSFLNELSLVTEKYLLYRTERGFETLKIYKNMAKSIGETY